MLRVRHAILLPCLLPPTTTFFYYYYLLLLVSRSGQQRWVGVVGGVQGEE